MRSPQLTQEAVTALRERFHEARTARRVPEHASQFTHRLVDSAVEGDVGSVGPEPIPSCSRLTTRPALPMSVRSRRSGCSRNRCLTPRLRNSPELVSISKTPKRKMDISSPFANGLRTARHHSTLRRSDNYPVRPGRSISSTGRKLQAAEMTKLNRAGGDSAYSRPMKSLLIDDIDVGYSDLGYGEPVFLVHAGVFSEWFLPVSEARSLHGFRVIRVRRGGDRDDDHFPPPDDRRPCPLCCRAC